MTQSDQTAITSAARAVAEYAQDAQTRSWLTPEANVGDPMSGRPNTDALLRHTQREIAELRRLSLGWDGSGGLPLRPPLANIAYNVVRAVISDSAATPQFSPTGDGGVNIIWLVDGDRLTINLEPDEVVASAVWANGTELFRYYVPWNGMPSEAHVFDEMIDHARVFLEKISDGVQHQLLAP